MSVAKKQQTKKTKIKSPKASEKKKIKKQLEKSSADKKTPTTKKKTLPKNKPSAKESKPKARISKISEKKLKDGFLPDQYVVYPSHGVGKVIEIEKREIAGQMLEMYVIEFEQEKIEIMDNFIETNKEKFDSNNLVMAGKLKKII